MGIHVIQSQRIEVLVQGVIQTDRAPSRDPFKILKTQQFVVPSAAIQEWLTQRLAEHQGISANSMFHQGLRGFQWFAYQQILTDKDKVRKANIPRLIMKWRIYQVLKPFIESEQIRMDAQHPLYPLIERIYESAIRLTGQLEKIQKKTSMLYWISDQVSKLFSHYMVYRADCRRACEFECNCPENWLKVWGGNQPLDIEKQFQLSDGQENTFKFQQAQQLESWQRWLWLHTFNEDFVEMQSIDHDFWTVLNQSESRENALKKLPSQLVVFTLLELAPSQLQFLRRLGQYIDVLILHYNPSQEYWADSVDPNWKKRYDLGLKERFISKYEQRYQIKPTDEHITAFFEKFTLNFNSLVRESRHPLLTRMGKQARDHFSLLSNLATGSEGRWVDAFVDDFPTHLLGRLQSDILHLVEPEEDSYLLDPSDDSIQIHVCHSSMRQLEVLKDQLIYWLSQSSAEHPRRPSDILVLIPDLKQIEALVRSVFPQKSSPNSVHLPVKIAGVTQLDVALSWRAVLGRIELLQTRFTVDDFADWLNLNATQTRYQLDILSIQRMLELLQNAGFKRGFDEQHLKQTLSSVDQDYRFSFKYALDRLSLGIAVPVHQIFVDTLSYEEVLAGDFELVAILLQIYEDFAHRRDWLKPQHMNVDFCQSDDSHRESDVESWLHRLLKEISEFEQAGVTSLNTVREIILKQIRMLTLARFYDDDQAVLQKIELPLAYILTEIQNTLDSQVDQALPTGHITFSQLGMIRPVPYRLVVVLNLDGGKFPNRDSHLPFDLMELLRPQLGDRSRLEDDQGAFLDAMLLAQENFWLFYNGFDVSDGEVRDPSSSVQELVQHLAYIVSELPEAEGNQKSDQIQQDVIITDQIEIPKQLKTLYRVYPMQPFDPVGYSQQFKRYQDHWYGVAKQLDHKVTRQTRQAWVNTRLEPQIELKTYDADQWIRDICFPARLYLKTLGVSNIQDEQLPELNEPLLLDGLARYSIREFLAEHQTSDHLNPELLMDQLPVGKVLPATLKMSLMEFKQLQKRLHQFASEPSKTTKRNLNLDDGTLLQITVPEAIGEDWVSLNISSAKGQRRAQIWLEYLLWLTYLNVPDEESRHLKRIAVFSDNSIICTGLTPQEAKTYLQHWQTAFEFASKQPLVLPAALLMKLATEGKILEWTNAEDGSIHLQNFEKLQNEWNKSDAFLSYRLNQSEESKLHQDWQFILQDQDSNILLREACDRFAYALYQPIYLHQFTVEE